MTDNKILIVYNYDPLTFEYYSSEPASRNPLNEDEPLIPACATTVEPVKPKKGYAVVWLGNKWGYKKDHRNEIWFNAQTKQLETIDFIGELPDYYFTPDSPIANPPEGDYWEFDSEKQEWVGNAGLYKIYVLNNFSTYWDIKQNTPFEFKDFKYLPSWRELYTSIWVSLSSGIKTEYRLEDYDGKYNTVNKTSMKEIFVKMSNIVDEMYTDKQNLELYIKKENDFNKLQKAFNTWVEKEYK